MKNISIRLPENLRREVAKLADFNGLKEADIVRVALTRMVRAVNKGETVELSPGAQGLAHDPAVSV
ncbi:MAG: hypothetical protein LBK76_09885 [Verrucomicrobiales bacterium]|jgi:hypothetical protein|nr:hypothetical protein [Verrucomicrobiales bacterium]